MKFGKLVVVFLSLCLWTGSVFAQEGEAKKLVYKAEKLMFIKNYTDAIPVLQEAIKADQASGKIQYLLASCFYQSQDVNTQIKSIPHYEKALELGGEGVDEVAHYRLGQMYHKTTAVNKAIEKFEDYLELIGTKDRDLKQEVERRIEQANNALALISQSRVVEIFPISDQINTRFTEYNPVVSTDESVIAYTSVRQDEGKSRNSGELIEEIYINYKEGGSWTPADKLDINTRFNVGTAGISADGEKMLVFIGGAGNTGNLYEIEKIGNDWSSPAYLGNTINSNYLESTASITPDGKTLYFASNRPGGFGGMDVYVVQKDEEGNWGTAVNLGSQVNTRADEDAPFIHPDERQLFFTSEGHNSMGGKDIFKTTIEGGNWTDPVNMGYPINTPTDDNYFTLTADGRKGFFSSDRPGGKGGQDIYYINMPEEEANIPLTVIKGKILNGETLQPIPTKILVVDVESGNKIDYVYNPNTESGNYLVILPPGRNYDMIIESDGYTPYTINVNIPNQNYFYELYQEILLSPVKQFDVLVGQEVQVKNAFYDTKQDEQVNPRQANEAMLVRNDSLDLYDIMDGIIASEDSVAYEYFLDLMYTINPIENVDFQEGGPEGPVEQASRTYYYDESTTEDLEAKLVDGKTIYSLPTLYVTEEDALRRKNLNKRANISYEPEVLKPIYKIYFNVGESAMDQQYGADLDKVLNLLNQHKDLGVEISGYASSEGDPEFNRKLSNERAIEVLNYFNYKGIVRRRIIARGYGATKANSGNNEESRRVEVRLVDLNSI